MNATSSALLPFTPRTCDGWRSAPRCITTDTSPSLAVLWRTPFLQAYSVRTHTGLCFESSTLPLLATSWGGAGIPGSAAERQLKRNATQIRASKAEFLMLFVIQCRTGVKHHIPDLLGAWFSRRIFCQWGSTRRRTTLLGTTLRSFLYLKLLRSCPTCGSP